MYDLKHKNKVLLRIFRTHADECDGFGIQQKNVRVINENAYRLLK